jgi:signal transduction histidine kinase/ligand-binding sensor domain-containing protein
MGKFSQFACAWFLVCSAHAAITNESVRFRSYGTAHGLSQVTARALAEDSKGFLWVGTQDGLNRFDGYEFKSYFFDPERKSSISDNHITALAFEPGDVLWVGTLSGGLNRFDLRSEKAERFNRLSEPAFSGGSVADLEFDAAQQLWVLSDDASPRIRRQGQFEGLRNPQWPLGTRWYCLARDGEAMLLGGDQGVWRQPATGEGAWLLSKDQLAGAVVGTLETSATEVFVGTNGSGLFVLNKADGTLQHFQHERGNPKSLADDLVRDVLYSARGELWIGTQRGISYFDPSTRAFSTWNHDGSDSASIAGNRVHALFEASQGLMWIGTWTGGISVHDAATRSVSIARHQASRPQSLPTNPVRSIYREPDGTLWMGLLDGGGLIHYDLKAGVLERFLHDPGDPRSLPHDQVQSVIRRRDGSLWVATIGGLARQEKDGKFQRFLKSDATGAMPTNTLIHLFEDDERRLWIATDDEGALVLCSDCTHFARVLDARPGSGLQTGLPSRSLNTIASGPNGKIFIGTANSGLVLLDPKTNSFQTFQAKPGVAGALSHNAITSINPSVRGGYWIGTQGGGINYLSFAPGSGEITFESLDKRDGLSADAVGFVIEDHRGHAWIATTAGISEYDPERRSLRTINAADGLDRMGYFINSVAKAPDGTVFFGGLNGMVWFEPGRVRSNRSELNVSLADFRLFNRSLPSRDVEPESPLAVSPSYVERLDLSYGQDIWSVVFSGLNFTAPESTTFSTWLEGFDAGWINTSNRVASYSRVPAGRYMLHARASSDSGMNYGPELRIAIVIAPPWWRSPIAYLAYVALLGVIAWWMLQRAHRRRRERSEHARAVSESQERLRMALWGSRDELWDVHLPEGYVVRENPIEGIATESHLDLEDLNRYSELVHPDDRAGLSEAFRAHLKQRTEFFEYAYRMRGRHSEWVWILARGKAVSRTEDGRALRIVGTNRDVSALKDTESRLLELNNELEQRVERRTEALVQINTRLERTLNELTDAQRRLVESEKLASLGNLVAGISHEINTPVGIGVTAASHLKEQTEKLQVIEQRGELKRSDFLEYLRTAQESSTLVLRNLERASQLIRSFKQVAVDQSSEQRRVILLKDYLNEVLFALMPKLKRSKHKIEALEGENLQLDTYPGALYQIVANLVTNSLLHGFKDGHHGRINISWERASDVLILRYRDNGIGMNAEVAKRIFDPFFTTKRGQGGSGLGMHITYNLVTQLLKGHIELTTAPEQGVLFEIRLPVLTGEVAKPRP